MGFEINKAKKVDFCSSSALCSVSMSCKAPALLLQPPALPSTAAQLLPALPASARHQQRGQVLVHTQIHRPLPSQRSPSLCWMHAAGAEGAATPAARGWSHRSPSRSRAWPALCKASSSGATPPARAPLTGTARTPHKQAVRAATSPAAWGRKSMLVSLRVGEGPWSKASVAVEGM